MRCAGGFPLPWLRAAQAAWRGGVGHENGDGKTMQCGGKKYPLSALLSPPWWPPPQQSVGVVMGPQQSGRAGLGLPGMIPSGNASWLNVAAAVSWLRVRGAAN